MFCVMQINSIPAVYLTARVAACSIIFLYLAVILCFPAYCYLDMKRQAGGRSDICVWKHSRIQADKEDSHYLEKLLYNRCYKPLILGEFYIRVIVHSLIWACAALLLGLGLYGISVSTVGLGLQVRSYSLPSITPGFACTNPHPIVMLGIYFRTFCPLTIRGICGHPLNRKFWDRG